MIKTDSNNVMRAHAIKKYDRTIPLFVQVLLPQNITFFSSLADHVMCVDALKLGILSQNILSPGFLNFFNLLTTSIPETSIQKFSQTESVGKQTHMFTWMSEFIAGGLNEIYTVS